MPLLFPFFDTFIMKNMGLVSHDNCNVGSCGVQMWQVWPVVSQLWSTLLDMWQWTALSRSFYIESSNKYSCRMLIPNFWFTGPASNFREIYEKNDNKWKTKAKDDKWFDYKTCVNIVCHMVFTLFRSKSGKEFVKQNCLLSIFVRA